MVQEFEVRWEGELPASPAAVWDAITKHAGAYLWPIEYEPRIGGRERGLTGGGGTVTAWEPARHFATRSGPTSERDRTNELDSVEGPASSRDYGFVRVRRALGLSDDVVAGEPVRLTPAGLEPVDFANDAFLGIRSADALYRVYGRDAWEMPVGVAHHLFADDVDQAAAQQAWAGWIAGVFERERVA